MSLAKIISQINDTKEINFDQLEEITSEEFITEVKSYNGKPYNYRVVGAKHFEEESITIFLYNVGITVICKFHTITNETKIMHINSADFEFIQLIRKEGFK